MADKPFPSSSQHSPVPSSFGESGPTSGDSGTGASGPRGIGQRSSDARDAMAEMAERAQQISQEAGTKIAAAMKEVIGAAAGLAGFAVESARDLVQYMVRRGQMTQDEADKLIREAEDAHGHRSGRTSASKVAAAEKASVSTKREPAKPATMAAKRPSGAAAATKPEKKAPVRGEAAPKKAAAKPPSKKKR